MRQRIVINLEEAKREGAKPVRKRRRWLRVLGIVLVLGLVMVVAAAAGAVLWYRSTPTYTLALIFDAAQRNDAAEFQKRIDSDEIAKNMTAVVSQKAVARYGYALNSSTQQQIDSTMPSLLPRVKQAVQDELFNAMKAFAAAPQQQSFISIVGAVKKFLTVTTDGNSAKATGSMAGHNIEMVMRRDADDWKVTDVKDELIVQRIVDSVIKELPPIEKVDPNWPFLKKPQRKRGPRKIKMSNSAEQSRTFESSLEALEQIVRQLEDGDLPLEKSLELFEQGIRLSRECQERLSQAERRIEILLRDNQGRPVAAAFKEPPSEGPAREEENGF